MQSFGEKFLSSKEFTNHKQKHLRTYIDTWSNVNEKKDRRTTISNDIPDGLNRELYKVFEKYHIEGKAMVCLWRNSQLNCAMREPSREHQLQTRLKEWLEE